MKKTTSVLCTITLSLSLSLVTSLATAQVKTAKSVDSKAPRAESNPYMGAPVTLVKAPNGAIANKKLLDGTLRKAARRTVSFDSTLLTAEALVFTFAARWQNMSQTRTSIAVKPM
jgi:hypothetical protein